MATYYIATTGDNSNDGLSVGNSWLNFTHVNDGTLSAGDIVNVGAGTYTDQIVAPVASTGSIGNLVTIQAISGQECTPVYTTPSNMTTKTCNVIIDGGGANVVGVNLSAVDYWKISGIGVTNCRGGAGVYADGTTGSEFYNLKIYENGAEGVHDDNGLEADASELIVIENCEFANNTWDAIKISSDTGAKEFLVKLCYFHGNYDDGITTLAFNDAGKWSIIEFCKFEQQFGKSAADSSDFHPDAIEVNAATRLIIRYNILFDFPQLIYFAGFGGTTPPDRAVADIHIYGNVMWNDAYDNDVSGTIAAVHFDMAGNDSLNDVYIWGNTFGYCATDLGQIRIVNIASITADNIVIRNNIFFDSRDDNTKDAITIDPTATNIDSDFNCFYNMNDTANTNDITSDPKLYNYTGRGSVNKDFHLLSTSPCIGDGDTLLTTSVTVPATLYDVDVVTRTQNIGDMGAYEYVAAGAPVASPSVTYPGNRGTTGCGVGARP